MRAREPREYGRVGVAATAARVDGGTRVEASVELPAGGVFFTSTSSCEMTGRSFVGRMGVTRCWCFRRVGTCRADRGISSRIRWNAGETTGISENLLAGKLMAVEGEKTELIEQLQVQKNMTQTALEELLKAREELAAAKPSCCRRRRPPSRRRISSTVASAKRMSSTDSRGDAHVGSFVPPR